MKLTLKLTKIKNVCTCQRSVGPFDDDCEWFIEIMLKTNKRGGDQVISSRIPLNALDHYNIYSERNVK